MCMDIENYSWEKKQSYQILKSRMSSSHFRGDREASKHEGDKTRRKVVHDEVPKCYLRKENTKAKMGKMGV